MEKDISNEPGEVKVTVTLVLNASFKPTKNFISYHVVLCVLLGGIALAAIVINLCLLSAIFFNSNLKRLVLNQFVSVVSFACVLECLVNAPFALFHMRTSEPFMGDTMCKINAACLILLGWVITCGMCGLCFERWFSIFRRNNIKPKTLYKQIFTMVLPVLIGIIVIIPIALNFIEVRNFPHRYSCSVALRKDEPYRVIILLAFVFPVFLGSIALICSLLKNYRNIKNVNSQNIELSYAELFFEESHLWSEWQSSKFVACITVLFLFLEIPFIFNEIDPINNSQLLKDIVKANSTSYFVPTQMTSPNDRAYTWCKFLFCLLFPITTFALRKEIRRKISSLLSFCRADSTILSRAAEEGTSSPSDNPEDFLVPKVWRRRRLSSVTSLTSPIVFGKSKLENSYQHSHHQNQLLDLSTGMARFKATYEETKRREKTLFDEIFEDDDEFVEYSRYEDGTEEEINSSEDFKLETSVKEVGVQTNDKVIRSILLPTKSPSNSRTLGKSPQKNRNRRISKSFTSNRTNNAASFRRNYYLTYPKLPASSRRTQANVTTSELLKILKAYRSQKPVPACDIIPHTTGELLVCTLDEGKNIVSL
ncbi:hypothetical protein JTE90_011520 [Oedothorax gibbosus]|uniref:G-protein coupled receptors family 1 profile domain-containing protein n=1 Tax=Oedothorax gibbosus TaxID=931172 RepID=A0AAV6UIQ2_9ARAC|nr:hypothetical protein JTE90_011520 [Oedothorax gibbosus]